VTESVTDVTRNRKMRLLLTVVWRKLKY